MGATRGPVAVVGDFVMADGRRAERLALPAGSRLVEDCQPRQPGDVATCFSSTPAVASVSIVASDGLVVKVSGDGEVAVAGAASANALGRSWAGQVVAVEAGGLEANATYRNGGWEVTGSASAARQVWVDVWPVVETTLSARSVVRSPGIRDSYSLRIQWTNVGFASSQIFEAQGRGPGASQVEFDLNKTSGHDAGLGVSRGDRVLDLKGGGDIDSNLAPGDSVDRGVSHLAGSPATIVLRGNFPEVSVALAIPAP